LLICFPQISKIHGFLSSVCLDFLIIQWFTPRTLRKLEKYLYSDSEIYLSFVRWLTNTIYWVARVGDEKIMFPFSDRFDAILEVLFRAQVSTSSCASLSPSVFIHLEFLDWITWSISRGSLLDAVRGFHLFLSALK